MTRAELDPAIADEVPWSDQLTDYDERHFVVYLRLIDATAAGASSNDMARIVLGIDPQKEPGRAQQALASHLKRARWMMEHGYKHLLA